MISKTIINALKVLIEGLSSKDINWAIIGSTNLALQGVDVEPNDIDILTDKKGAFLIGNSLRKFVVKPIEYRETERFGSYTGLFKIKNAEIEVIGDLYNKIPGADLWTERSGLSAKRFILFHGLNIPVISLEQEYLAYRKMGRNEKARKIKTVLEEQYYG